ncbi:hypothetical protein HII31_09647 [Pseudocercospora fuligena]|uniref:E3 ubiquitin-protein ligase n=1 Tax=Pseudocercospora fuligena TaxID=685502 RepID=A0A8H6RCE6_9PEZI|nr:hypothetical protein HII31_09647 [Pseudocercospora fuligena]
MSVSTIPPSGLTLHGVTNGAEPSKHTSTPAILFKLSEDVLKDVKSAANVQGGLQFVTGTTPKIRLGKRTIDLTISPEAFRHELYSASTESIHDLKFTGLVGHRAELKVLERKQSLGPDAALAALQNTLAAAKQERQAKSVNISNAIVREPKNRYEANREQKYAHRRGLSGSQHASPALSAAATPRLGAAPTSAPASNSAAREKAMKMPLVHLLAIKPLTHDEMCARTRIPKDELEKVVEKIVQPIDGKWELTKGAYKELDVWNFAYSTQAERQAAIDNAIRAYDRLRIGKDEEIWQRLLPKEDRGKGIVLSKLNIGGGAAYSTPHHGASPLPHGDAGADEKAATPLVGSGTPRVGSGKNNALKSIIGKTSKQRAVEEAKEKKRKEREAAAAASDREGKPAKKKQTTKTNNPKVKSAEIVQDSSEESEENMKVGGATSSSQPKAAPIARKPAANAAPKPKAKALASTSPPSSDAHETPQQKKAARLAAEKEAAAAAKAKAKSSNTTAAAAKSKAATAAPGKSTPNGLAAPTSSSQQRHQLSPNKPDHRPTAPSPLGAARPRVASDVSDRAAVGVQRTKPGAETPKGLGISNVNGIRKRHDTVTSTGSHHSTSSSEKSNGVHKKPEAEKVPKAAVNGNSTPKPSMTNGADHKSENGVKRKAVDSPITSQTNGHAAKHRKTESSSSQSQKSQKSGGAVSSNEALERSVTSDSAASNEVDVSGTISYRQGVAMAQKFHDDYYPNYTKLYDEQAAMEKRGETVPKAERQKLWTLHRRLEAMKREIRAASEREHDE